MNHAVVIVGDWGTSHLRLMLCARDGSVLDRHVGPGAAAARGAFAAIFDSLTADWVREHGAMRGVLCGMVGSNFGWSQVPYQSCPATLERIATGCLALRDGLVLLTPGLSCRNRLGAPDFLRGEEAQILGALQIRPSTQQGRHLLCLPGTHTKWVLLEAGAVQGFHSAPTGEVFEVICHHSVLVADRAEHLPAEDPAAFEQALRTSAQTPAELLHRLFECRSRRLSGELHEASAASYLSGLLIASDVDGALRLFADADAAPEILLIGMPALTRGYGTALQARGRSVGCLDGAEAALAGLLLIDRLVPTRH
jgi:2-dehydro-3-deoxygalactonokinase